MKLEMKVTTKYCPLNVRTGPGNNYRVLGTVPKGSTIIATESKNGWYKHSKGWSYGGYLKTTKNLEKKPATKKTNPNEKPKDTTGSAKSAKPKDPNISKIAIPESVASGKKFGELKYVFGMPHQFNGEADNRSYDATFGRKYIENIVEDMSLVFFTPGRAELLAGMKQDKKEGIIKKMLGGEDYEASYKGSKVRDIIAGEKAASFYSFISDYVDYVQYVNAMCRISAVYLGIGDKKMFPESKSYRDFDWNIKDYARDKFSTIFKYISEECTVAFYVDGQQTSTSDGSSTSTDKSFIEGMMEKGTDMSKEIRFLLGNPIGDDAIMASSLTNYETVVNKILGKVFKANRLNAVTKQFKDYGFTLINGGNMLMPDVWRDSSTSKSYNIEIKLASPYGDPESIYLNILVPLFHLIALAYPRQLGKAGYMQPFIVRAFCQGWFNCDMGVIDSISIKKGSQDGWSVCGLPTEIDVSISLKDLYETTSIARVGDKSLFGNTSFLDFIGTMSGVNINKPDIARKMALYKMFVMSKPNDVIRNLKFGLMEDISSFLTNLLK